MKTALKALGILPLLLVACGGTSSVEEAEAELCEEINEFGEALVAYSQLNAESTVNELEDAREDVVSSYEEVQEAAAEVEEARVSDLQAAYAELEAVVNDVSGDETLGEAAVEITRQLANVQAAREQLYSNSNCQ